MKHTKGNWKLRKDHKEPFLVKDHENGIEWYANSYTIFNSKNRIIACVDYMTDTKNMGYGRINNLSEFDDTAKIISKAPEMYEALIMAMSTIINHGSSELVEKYTLLIKKIES